MPQKKKEAKEAPKKLNKKTLESIKKMAVTFSVYEQRMALRATIEPDEKNRLFREFFENYQDDIGACITENDLHTCTEEELKQKGLDKTSIAFITTFEAFRKSKGGNVITGSRLGKTSYAYIETKEFLERGAERSASKYEDGDDVEVSDEQAKGLRDIAKWMYRNSEDRTASRRGSAHLGWTSHIIFIEEILKKSAKQRLLIFYLIENGKTKGCTPEDVVMSQTYIPDLNAFKSKIQKNKVSRFFAKESIKWTLLGEAAQQAGIAIGSSSLNMPKVESEEEKERREAKEEKDLDVLTLSPEEREEAEFLGAFNMDSEEDAYCPEFPSIDDQLRLLPHISSKLRELIDSDENLKGSKDIKAVKFEKGSDKEAEYTRLIKALSNIQKNMTEYFYQKAAEDPDGRAGEKLTDAKPTGVTNILKKMGDGLSKLPLTNTMSAGTAISAIAVLIRAGGLIKNGKILSSGDIAERVLGLLAACADLSANASKLGLISTAVNVGAAAGTATAVSGALGIVSGGLSMASAAVNAGKADALRKGTNKAEGHLNNARNYEINDSDTWNDLLMADDVQQFVRSMYHTKALAAGKDMISGTLTAIGGALTLTGAGTIPGLIMVGLGLVTNVGGMIAGKVAAGKEKKKLLDNFFGLDAAMRVIEAKGLCPKNRKVKSAIKKELKAYAEAKIGAANDDQAYNIIMSRYAHFLYMKTFVKKGGGFYTAADYEGKPQNADEEIAFACKTLVSSMGVKLKFGATNNDMPETTESDIKRRMKL